jgi:hypothetical protein
MKTPEKKLPQNCPSCASRLKVKKLHCSSCSTEVDGLYDLPLLASFNNDEQEFIIAFIKASGSLKEMANIMDKSYPSVRNYLDELINKVKQLEKK